jgi:flagellar protein FlgJ
MTEISFYTPPFDPAQASNGGHALTEAKGRVACSSKSDRGRLAKACSEFEAIFIEQLFKTMRSTVPGSGPLHGGRAEEIYTGMLDQQIAMEMAGGQGSIGLASRMQSRLISEEPASEEQASPKR